VSIPAIDKIYIGRVPVGGKTFFSSATYYENPGLRYFRQSKWQKDLHIIL
jgi:hypothetical protein